MSAVFGLFAVCALCHGANQDGCVCCCVCVGNALVPSISTAATVPPPPAGAANQLSNSAAANKAPADSEGSRSAVPPNHGPVIMFVLYVAQQ